MNYHSKIIDGRHYAQQILSELELKIQEIRESYNEAPGLAIILVGDDPASSIYVKNKLKAAAKIGIKARLINFPSDISVCELLSQIKSLNSESDVSGIILQLPLPLHIEKNIILSAVSPQKDVDGFHPINVGYLHNDFGDGFVPCTALGCTYLLKQVEPNLSGKHAVIIGRSNIVGKPLSAMLLRENCTVTICHSKTQNLEQIASNADIIVSAIGAPLILGPEYFRNNAIVIDVGINREKDTCKIVGDVNFNDVLPKVKHISPVPGGVGPMTVAFLLQNTVKAFLNRDSLNASPKVK